MNRRKFISSLLGAAIGAGIAAKIPLPAPLLSTEDWVLTISDSPYVGYGFTGWNGGRIAYRELKRAYVTACNSKPSPELMIMSRAAHSALLKSAYGDIEK